MTASDPAPVNPAFVQLGYTTNDMARAQAFLRDTGGVRAFLAWPGADIAMTLWGRPATARADLAFAWRGDTMIEIIRPLDGAIDIYEAGVGGPDFVLKLHHVGIGVPGGEDAFDRILADLAAAGHPTAGLTRAHMGSYALVDTRATAGHYTEYLWNKPEGLAYFGTVPRS
jgi:hypothetical protein